ncbi:methyltransferase [Gemmata sp.]|uniref:methyltransferase n=1 Tax=Gemmata sp. TaxID=1914242 RepID=UPI003F6E5205
MSPTPPAPPPEVLLMQMAFGKAVTQALSVAARFKIADQLVDGPKTAAELATATGLHAGHLYRVLRALAGMGVFAGDEAARFSLTPMGNLLRTDVPGSVRPIATYVCDPWSWKPWGDLAGAVKSGQPVFDRMFGEGVFDYFAKHPDEAATFNEGMTGFSQQAAAAVLKAYDFSKFGTVVDVGGGHGALLTAILKANPAVKGVVFDAPSVAVGATEAIKAAGLGDRCRAEGGDFFTAVPTGDLILMKNIIHDWNDERATGILKACRAALAPTGTLLLVELVVPPGFAPHMSHVLDLEMMVICDGKERTEAEYRTLLSGAGFRLTRVVPTEGPFGLVEAVPA